MEEETSVVTETEEKKAGLLTDNEGNVSSMRFIVIGTIATILAVFVAHNINSLITGKEFIDFGQNSFFIILSLAGAKTVQKFAEVGKNIKNLIKK